MSYGRAFSCMTMQTRLCDEAATGLVPRHEPHISASWFVSAPSDNQPDYTVF